MWTNICRNSLNWRSRSAHKTFILKKRVRQRLISSFTAIHPLNETVSCSATQLTKRQSQTQRQRPKWNEKIKCVKPCSCRLVNSVQDLAHINISNCTPSYSHQGAIKTPSSTLTHNCLWAGPQVLLKVILDFHKVGDSLERHFKVNSPKNQSTIV